MEDATDNTVESVTIMCASQIMKTTILENVVGYFIDVDPAPILMVQPTVGLSESFSKERLTPMIRDCPCLQGKVKEARSRDSENTILMKSFPGGNIAMVGANAPSGLAGRPRRVVLEDEIDRYPASAGNEGDPCSLAERRTETFYNAVVYRTSTPTIKGFSRIEAAYELTDKRMWFCPCPRCQQHQTLKWSQILWGKRRVEASAPTPATSPDLEIPTDGSDAVYQCEHCKARLNDAERLAMVMAGEWRATAKFQGKRGYHLNGIASPFRHKKGFKSRMHQMVAGFLEAKRGGRETYKTWVNTFLAETYEDEGDKMDHGDLVKRGEGYSTNNLPEQIIMVGCGIDVQGDRLEFESIGLGLDDETWGIEAGAFFGDTEQDDVWQDLANHLAKKYERDDGAVLPITMAAIDMRHKPHKVRKFVTSCGHPRVYPVYGIKGTTPVLVTTRFNKHYRLRTYSVNTKLAKDILFARLRITEDGPRYLHFPQKHGYSEEYFLQLTAEVLKTGYKHGYQDQYYEKIRERNEALDRRVYFLAALDILKPNLTAIAKHLQTSQKTGGSTTREYVLDPAKSPEPTPPAPAKPTFVPKALRPRRPGRGGFLNSWRK